MKAGAEWKERTRAAACGLRALCDEYHLPAKGLRARLLNIADDLTDAPPASTPALSAVDHPAHYGGAADPFEAIKVIEAWSLGFCLGNTVKYIRRADLKGAPIEDLEKAAWYLNREIQRRKDRAT